MIVLWVDTLPSTLALFLLPLRRRLSWVVTRDYTFSLERRSRIVPVFGPWWRPDYISVCLPLVSPTDTIFYFNLTSHDVMSWSSELSASIFFSEPNRAKNIKRKRHIRIMAWFFQFGWLWGPGPRFSRQNDHLPKKQSDILSNKSHYSSFLVEPMTGS